MAEIGLIRAAKKFRVSPQAILDAIKRGAIPVQTVPVLELRMKTQDIVAWLATVPEWRQKAGRMGAEIKWTNYYAKRGIPRPASRASARRRASA